MLEPECLRWALSDLAEASEIQLVRVEDALQVADSVSGESILVSCRDGWKLKLEVEPADHPVPP